VRPGSLPRGRRVSRTQLGSPACMVARSGTSRSSSLPLALAARVTTSSPWCVHDGCGTATACNGSCVCGCWLDCIAGSGSRNRAKLLSCLEGCVSSQAAEDLLLTYLHLVLGCHVLMEMSIEEEGWWSRGAQCRQAGHACSHPFCGPLHKAIATTDPFMYNPLRSMTACGVSQPYLFAFNEAA